MNNDICEKCENGDAESAQYNSGVDEEDVEITQNAKPVKNYFNKPKTVFVPDAIDKKKKIIK